MGEYYAQPTVPEDDLYEGYNNLRRPPRPARRRAPGWAAAGGRPGRRRCAAARLASRAGVPPGTRSGKPVAGEENRPMTAVRAAGYTAAGGKGGGIGAAFNPMGDQNRGPAPPLEKRADNSPEDMAREMEKEVNGLIEESARLSAGGQPPGRARAAKEAGKLERQLCKHREQNGLGDAINIDLTYSVCFNLANMYHLAGMYTPRR